MVKTAEKGVINVEGNEITISNPQKPLWPEMGITKLDYLRKLTVLAPYLIRYCQNRYLTVIRYPHGVGDKSFYQKNAPHPIPEFVDTAVLNEIRYVNLNSLSTLLWLGNLASLEFHASFEYIGTTQPAEWMIDLDPTREEEPRMMEVASIVGEVLKSLNIQSVPKTSGATGIQIVVPIQDGYTFEQLRSIGHFIAQYVVEKYPKLFTIERLKSDRGDKIYFDYLQHWPGKTLSAPYTPRARKTAAVSTPLTWDEVRKGVNPSNFNLLTIEKRIQEKGDLIAKVTPQNLDSVLKYINKKDPFNAQKNGNR